MSLSVIDTYVTRRIAGFCDEPGTCSLAAVNKRARHVISPVCLGVAGSLRMARSLTTGQPDTAAAELAACCGVPGAPAAQLLAFLRSTCSRCPQPQRLQSLLDAIDGLPDRTDRFYYQPHLAYERRESTYGLAPQLVTNTLVLDAWRRLATALWPEAGGGERWNRWRDRGLVMRTGTRARAAPRPICLQTSKLPSTWTKRSRVKVAMDTAPIHSAYRLPSRGSYSYRYWRKAAPVAMALIY